jgi:tRNA pseudouridine55 synthase
MMSLFGILNVNKAPGRTSRDVVDHIERLVRPDKAGHAGTLDPLARGVLVICVGRATRLIQYVQRMPKQYRATFLLGRRSETDDVESQVVEIAGAPPSRAALERALPAFMGEIQQRPPAYSAIKIAGRRAYQLARRGEQVQLASRPVTIHRLDMIRYEYPQLELDVECGSGTYIRALGRDLAAALGTAAVMSALERTAIGHFTIDGAVSLDELSAETLPQHLQPAATAVADLARIELNDPQQEEIRHGRPIALPVSVGAGRSSAAGITGEVAAMNSAGELIALLQQKRIGQLWPVANFA